MLIDFLQCKDGCWLFYLICAVSERAIIQIAANLWVETLGCWRAEPREGPVKRQGCCGGCSSAGVGVSVCSPVGS